MEVHTHLSLPDLLRNDPKDRENFDHDLNDDVRHGCGRSDLYICLEPLKKVCDAAKEVYKGILASAEILNGLIDVTVTKARVSGQERCSLGRGRQSQRKSHSKVGISAVMHVRRWISSGLTSRNLPAQHRSRGLQRMRTRHLQWGLATLSNFHLHFETDRTPGLVLEARREWHWESRRTVAGRLGDGRQCLSLSASCTLPKQL